MLKAISVHLLCPGAKQAPLPVSPTACVWTVEYKVLLRRPTQGLESILAHTLGIASQQPEDPTVHKSELALSFLSRAPKVGGMIISFALTGMQDPSVMLIACFFVFGGVKGVVKQMVNLKNILCQIILVLDPTLPLR